MFFYVFIAIIAIQRCAELFIARRNEIWIKRLGGIEAGKNHYKFMVFIHIIFFVSLSAEVIGFHKPLIPYWWFLFALFVLTQAGRIWVIKSLGNYWNTKILYLPNANMVTKGPYKFMKHPNYLIVTLELVMIPLMFQAYYTLIIFFILNQLILAIRIKIEEEVLERNTDYCDVQKGKYRFFPLLTKEK